MNKYFDKNDGFNSNNRIYEGYFTDVSDVKNPLQKFFDLLLLVLRTLSERGVIRKIKVAMVALSLVGFIGIIGAMEAGSLGMGTGLLIGAILLLVEYLCLRGHQRA